jgi:hypothetical protein
MNQALYAHMNNKRKKSITNILVKSMSFMPYICFLGKSGILVQEFLYDQFPKEDRVISLSH